MKVLQPKKARTSNMAAKVRVTSPESSLDRERLNHVRMELASSSRVLRAVSCAESIDSIVGRLEPGGEASHKGC